MAVRRPEAFDSIASGMTPTALFTASGATSSQMKSALTDIDVDHDNKDVAHEEEEQVEEDRPVTTAANMSSGEDEYETMDEEDPYWPSDEMDVEYEACEVEERRLHEAVLEPQSQHELRPFAGVPSRSYSNSNHTQSGPSSQLPKPDTIIFPPDHLYPSAYISGQYRYLQHHSPMPSISSSSAYTPSLLSAGSSETASHIGSEPPSWPPSVMEWQGSLKDVYLPEDEEMENDSGDYVGERLRYCRALLIRSCRH